MLGKHEESGKEQRKLNFCAEVLLLQGQWKQENMRSENERIFTCNSRAEVPEEAGTCGLTHPTEQNRVVQIINSQFIQNMQPSLKK